MEFISNSPQETENLGQRLATLLHPGDIVSFYGDLGAGKTAFIRGLALGLGITESVTSPTYTIVNEYPGDIPLFHFDLYRLSGPDDLFDIGWEDYLTRGGICAVEWSERAEEELEDSVKVNIQRLDDHQRRITITGGASNELSGN